MSLAILAGACASLLGAADLAMQRGPNFPEKLTTYICLRSPIGFEISWAVPHFCAPASLVEPTHHKPSLHHTSSAPQCIPLVRAMEGNDHGEPSSALHGIAWALSLSPIDGTMPLWPTT